MSDTAFHMKNLDRVLVIDFGSQYSHLIVRRLREINVFSELKRCDMSIEEMKIYNPKAIILSGGPSSVYEDEAPHFPTELWQYTEDNKIPMLGICYGLQEIIHRFCGTVEKSDTREFGKSMLILKNMALSDSADFGKNFQERARAEEEADPPYHVDYLFGGIETNRIFQEDSRQLSSQCNDTSSSLGSITRHAAKQTKALMVWMSHGDTVTTLPEGFESIAISEHSPNAAVRNLQKKIWGLQFHPEVTHTEGGKKILGNFVDICGIQRNWNMEDFLSAEIHRLRQLIKNNHVIGALSGGVDSTVAAALMHRAVGNRFHAILIDNGLLRSDESKEVMERLQSEIPNLSLICVDASERFLTKLCGVTNPEEKRKIIGAAFMEEFEDVVKNLDLNSAKSAAQFSGDFDCTASEITYLLQGTLYPDVIESICVRGPSHTIKTHHNVGGLPQHMKLKLIEPFRELFKDEVRSLGVVLGLSSASIWRHPFPGPGLAIRIVGEVTAERLDILRKADKIFLEEIRKTKDYDKISQAFVVLLPEAKSVGVMGDKRTYEMTAVLRAVCTTDFMTADWYDFPHETLRKISNEIINKVQGINRVCYDISSKPAATIEWE